MTTNTVLVEDGCHPTRCGARTWDCEMIKEPLAAIGHPLSGKRRSKRAPRDRPIFERRNSVLSLTPQTYNQHSTHRRRAGRGGIHLFRCTSEGARRPSSHRLDDHQEETQARPAKYQHHQPHAQQILNCRRACVPLLSNTSPKGRSLGADERCRRLRLLRTEHNL